MTVRKLPSRPPTIPATKKMAPPPMPTKKKTFEVEPWETNDGQRILIYADTGMGKTSLALLAPKPVFLGLDEGGADFINPVTNELIKCIPNIEDYQDVRTVLHQPDLFTAYETVVIDTVTVLQDWSATHAVATIPTEKGAMVKNLVGYGYNKGYEHLYNVMKDILTDLDRLIHQGKNVILIAQGAIHNVPNPSGEDFLRDGLRLHVDKSWDIESLYCEWCDHIFRIAYLNSFAKAKKITGTTERAVFIQPEVYFRAKSRTIHRPTAPFESTSDDSIWKILFEGYE